MPITVLALVLHGGDFARSWAQVNAEFEEVREEIELMSCGECRPSPGVVEEVMDRYQYLRGWLYGLLPELEDR